ncbi:MAG: helix-turn-helix domain-containing protein [Pseudomonadota bacterium]
MKAPPLLLVPYQEVRHNQPDDCLHYESVAIRAVEMDWTIPAHRHDALYQFQLLERGSVSGSIDGRVFEVAGPALLMLAPGSVHGFTYTTESVGHQITIPQRTLLNLLGLSDLAEKYLDTSFVVPLSSNTTQLKRLFDEVCCEYTSKELGRAQNLLCLASMIAVQLVRIQREQSARTSSPGIRDALAQRFLAMVEIHFFEHRSVSFYAEHLQVSADHLSKTCKHLLRRPAQSILNDRLMLEARRLLAYTAMPVAQISEQIGFTDSAYFTRSFGRSMGLSPSRYRASIAQGVRVPDV